MNETVTPNEVDSLIQIERALPEDAEAVSELLRKTWLSTYPNEEAGITQRIFDCAQKVNTVNVYRKTLKNGAKKLKLMTAL